MTSKLHHFFTLLGLALCVLGVLWLVRWSSLTAWWAFWTERDILAFFLIMLTGLGMVVGWRAAQLFLRLYWHRTTSRLAARDLRNTLSNCLFLFFGGEWKE